MFGNMCVHAYTEKEWMNRRLKGSLRPLAQFSNLSQFSLRTYLSKEKIHLGNGFSSVTTPVVRDLNEIWNTFSSDFSPPSFSKDWMGKEHLLVCRDLGYRCELTWFTGGCWDPWRVWTYGGQVINGVLTQLRPTIAWSSAPSSRMYNQGGHSYWSNAH